MTTYSVDLNHFAIRHTLTALGCTSAFAEHLLLATVAAQAEFLYQSNSHGIGAYGIDEASHLSLWDNYLAFRPDLASNVRGFASQLNFLQDPHAELATNLAYATAIAWVIYQSSGIALPHVGDSATLAEYWSQHFCHGLQSQANKEKFIVCIAGADMGLAA